MNNTEKLAIEYEDFRIIDETDKYILGYLWEQAYLYKKNENSEILLCEFYGICDAGKICDDENWCIVGGEIIAVWRDGQITIIDNDDLKWVHDIRLKNKNTAEILIDPWSVKSAIWELDIKCMEFKMITMFDTYKEKPYVKNVEW